MKKILFLLVIMLVPPFSFCQVKKVPEEFAAIQSAIDAAQPGDTVLVGEGTYYENITFNGKGIVLASNYIYTKDWNTVKNTIIDGSHAVNKDSASVVRLLNREDSTAVLEGFTITGGSGTAYAFSASNLYQEGAGIILSYSSAVIKNNIIINNGIVPGRSAVKDGGGGGIASMYGNPAICNNIIVSNNSGYAGGIVLNWSGGKIKNNIIYHNTGRASYGTGGVMLWECPANTAFLENNTIIGNISLKDAGGININVSAVTVKNNIVWGNRQVTGKQVSNPSRGSFNNMEDYTDVNNISVYPLLKENSFLPEDTSPCIDAGDISEIYNDAEDPAAPGNALLPSMGTIRNDIGAFGGPCALTLPDLEIYDIYMPKNIIINGKTNKEGLSKIAFLNLSSTSLKIDSVCIKNDTTSCVKLNFPGFPVAPLKSDTIFVMDNFTTSGIRYDTLFIYHNAKGISNPVRLPVAFNILMAVDVNDKMYTPLDYKLNQNSPNPFNPATKISFSIGKQGNAMIKIYDITGRETETLINQKMDAGNYDIEWKPKSNICSGIYFLRLFSGDFVSTIKMLYQK